MIKSTKKKETMKKQIKLKDDFIIGLAKSQLTPITDNLLKFYNTPMMSLMPKSRLLELRSIIEDLVLVEETLEGKLVLEPKTTKKNMSFKNILTSKGINLSN